MALHVTLAVSLLVDVKSKGSVGVGDERLWWCGGGLRRRESERRLVVVVNLGAAIAIVVEEILRRIRRNRGNVNVCVC